MSVEDLIRAIRTGDLGRVQELVDAGVDVNAHGSEQDWAPLNHAAGQGDLAIVEFLLDRGGDVTISGRDQRTPYMIALAAGHADVARRLRDAEARRPSRGESPQDSQDFCGQAARAGAEYSHAVPGSRGSARCREGGGNVGWDSRDVVPAHVPHEAHHGRHVAAKGIRVNVSVAAFVKREPHVEAIRVTLAADGAEFEIGPQKRHSPPHRLKVVPPTSRGTRIDEHAGMPASELVPIA